MFLAVGWLVGMRYPECFLFEKIIGFHAIWKCQIQAITFNFAIGIRWLVHMVMGLDTSNGYWICKLFMLRAVMVLLTWGWCVGLLIAHALTYSFLIAFLIVRASWKRNQI